MNTEDNDRGQDQAENIEETEVSPEATADEPAAARGKWGKVVTSFLFGALLTFAVTYFWLGGQNEAVATVNGEAITKDEFVEAVAAGGGAQMLDDMIVERLIHQKARDENVSISDEEYEEEIAAYKEQLPSEEMFEQLLAQQGLTEETFRQRVETNLLVEKLLGSKIDVSDEEVRNHFDENKEMFAQPEQVEAKHIVVETEAEANAVRDRLNNGEDFAEVAQDVSIDPQTKDNGGDMGTVSKGDLAQMDPDFEEKVFALEKGETSDPIQSLTGYHIVQVSEKTAAKEGEFNDEVAMQITEELKLQKMQEEAPAFIEQLRQDANIDNKLAPEDAEPVMQG